MNIAAPMPMISSEAVVIRVSSSAAFITVRFRRPTPQAQAMAPAAPMAPASVAVKRPENNPPKTSAIRRSTGQTRRSASSGETRSSSMGARGTRSGRRAVSRRTTTA